MEDSTDVDLSSKKAKKSRLMVCVSPLKVSAEKEICNGTDFTTNDSKKNTSKNKQKTSNMAKITKAVKTDKELTRKESKVQSPSPCDSPNSSSSFSDSFLGFDKTEELNGKQEVLKGLIEQLSNQPKASSSSAKISKVTKDKEGEKEKKEDETDVGKKAGVESRKDKVARERKEKEVEARQEKEARERKEKEVEEREEKEARERKEKEVEAREEKEAIERKEKEVEAREEEDSEEGTEIEQEEEDMTVDTGHVSDSDSNQMEIDISNKDSNSRADSVESIDKVGEKTIDSDVEVMDTDSVKGVDSKESKKTVNEDKSQKADSAILESTLKGGKVEYCGMCELIVNDEEPGIACDGACEKWFHLGCSGLTQAEYNELSGDENAKWACHKCSGKSRPPPPVQDFAKPKLSVRKDLAQILTPSPAAKRRSKEGGGRTPKIDISNPAFLKPFDYGWKRELVYRSTNDNQNRRQGDVYYYTPKGKKLRSLREIGDYLEGSDLTIDNFTFWKDPILAQEDPLKEIIRHAKLKLTNQDPNASPNTPKKVTPKTPKPPKPKLTATVTPLDTSGSSATPKISASVTPRIVFKGKASPAAGPKFKITPNKSTVSGQAQKITISKVYSD